ncbi:cyanophycinase [Fulvivirga sp.]|uniref:cyanophycinase n=1 Tax=Fulvivirga sp. TaxID=1931237 RepID=UPI0032EBAB44
MQKLGALLLFMILLSCGEESDSQQIKPEHYFTGNADVNTQTEFGIALMGGADANTIGERESFKFLVEKSGGGDFVVLRSSGSDGYNDFIFEDIGGVNSVTTLVIRSKEDANNSFVTQTVKNAEAVFIAGGDQSNYVNYWADSELQEALNFVLNDKKIPIGGTSAGLAVLGSYYYGALSDGIISSEALGNPYHPNMEGLTNEPLINTNFLSEVITDSHYSARGRQGRHFAFMARLMKDNQLSKVYGIGVDEATAAIIDNKGKARIFGNGDVYFLKGSSQPEVCENNQSLTWDHDGKAVEALIVNGTFDGANTFDLVSWTTSDADMTYWSAKEGEFFD